MTRFYIKNIVLGGSKIKKTFKKVLTAALALAMSFGAGPVGIDFEKPFATKAEALTYTYGVLTYEIKNGEAIITDCAESASGEFIIPDAIEDKPVTKIGSGAFKDCASLTSVIIPGSVTSVGGDNYYGGAFESCASLTDATILDGATVIGDYMFRGCENLTSVTIPDGVTSVGEDAFYNTGIRKDASKWENGVLYIGNHLIEAEEYIVSGAYTIRDGTKTIAGGAFSDCTRLTSVTIPDSVTSIGENAFAHCRGLTSVTIPDGVTNVGEGAFYDTGIYNDESNWKNGAPYIGNRPIGTKKNPQGEEKESISGTGALIVPTVVSVVLLTIAAAILIVVLKKKKRTGR